MAGGKKPKGTDKASKPSKWAEVRESGIHQKGLFAKRRIPAGTRIIEYVGEKIIKTESERRRNEQDEKGRASGNGTVYVFIVNDRYDIDGNVPWNIAKYANHSCDPNACSDVIKNRVWLIAERDIRKGEEIVYDYGFEFDGWEDHPCLCGARRCLGYIIAEEFRPRLKKALKARKKADKKRRRQRGH